MYDVVGDERNLDVGSGIVISCIIAREVVVVVIICGSAAEYTRFGEHAEQAVLATCADAFVFVVFDAGVVQVLEGCFVKVAFARKVHVTLRIVPRVVLFHV